MKLGTPEGFLAHWNDGISNEDYHADKDFWSSSMLKVAIQESPLALYDRVYNAPPKVSTDAMQLSSLVHSAVLEGEDFIRRYVIMPKFAGHANSKAYKEAKAEWLAEHRNKIIITNAEKDVLEGVYESIFNHPDAALILKEDCLFERSGYYVDPSTGVRCRIRYDGYNPNARLLADIKAVKSCRAEKFSYAIRDYRWDLSMAMYGQGIAAIDGREPRDYVFIAVEKTRPFHCAVYELEAESLDIGYADYHRSLALVEQCVTNNHWPTYQSNAQSIGLPDGMKRKYRL